MDANYPVLVSVKAVLPNERKPAPDEKPEDKARLDQQFQEKQKKLGEKLTREQKLAGRPYLIAQRHRGTIAQRAQRIAQTAAVALAHPGGRRRLIRQTSTHPVSASQVTSRSDDLRLPAQICFPIPTSS